MAKKTIKHTPRRVKELTSFYMREGLTLELARRRAYRKYHEEQGVDLYNPNLNIPVVI